MMNNALLSPAALFAALVVAWMGGPPLLGPRPAFAYETDQLTARSVPLQDSLHVTNARMDELIREAVDRTNRRTRCAQDPATTRRELARQIHRQTGRNKYVWGRGLFEGFGYGSYAAWMEKAPIDRRTFPDDRTDIYADLTLRESVILKLAGPCSTVRVSGELVGTDKFEHFLSVGYDYYKRSGGGADPLAAVAWGTSTERNFFGTLTSRTFSFGDLRANWDGYQFYADLFEDGSPLVIGDDGCVEIARPWDWAEWVDWEYDEVLNPSVYAPIVQWGLSRTLEDRSADLCSEYAVWGGPAYHDHLDRVLESELPPYVYGPAPARSDPYRLQTLCEGESIWDSSARPVGGRPRDAR